MGILVFFSGFGRLKQSQFKANLERSKIDFTYNTEDCHGPSGLAMTFVSILFCAFLCIFVAITQVEKTKPILWQGKSKKAKGKISVNQRSSAVK